MTKYVFNSANHFEFYPISKCLKQFLYNSYPVFICFGSSLSVGDSLGPIIGLKTLNKLKGKCYVYGTLKATITAKEAFIIYKTIKNLHPKSQIVIIDAAVGQKTDVGLIKVFNDGIKPGLGVDKNLDKVGDVSIIGIIGEKQEFNKNILSGVSANFIEELSNIISESIVNAILN